MTIANHNIALSLRNTALRIPDQTALNAGKESLSYLALADRAARFAAFIEPDRSYLATATARRSGTSDPSP